MEPITFSMPRLCGRAVRAAIVGILRIRVHGLERWSRNPNLIVVANHVSFIDGPVLASLSPSRHVFAVTRDFACSPLWSRVLKGLAWMGFGSFAPVDPSCPYGLRALVRALRQGEGAMIFPEGSISYDGSLAPLNPGAIRLARITGRPILPVRIEGLDRSVFGRNRKEMKLLPRVTITIHEPVSVVGLSDSEATLLLSGLLKRSKREVPVITTPKGRDGAVEV